MGGGDQITGSWKKKSIDKFYDCVFGTEKVEIFLQYLQNVDVIMLNDPQRSYLLISDQFPIGLENYRFILITSWKSN